MENDKIRSYLGFAMRAGKIVLGVDQAEETRRGICLLMADADLAENSIKRLVRVKEKFSCPLVLAKGESLGGLLHRPGVKAVGIKDKNLASAILLNAGQNLKYEIYSGGDI